MGYLMYLIHKKFVCDAVIEVTFTFLTPFASYLLAEHFHFSGVLALMAAGESNAILDKRAEAKGTKDLSTVDYGISLAAGVVYAAVNMLTKGNAGLADAKATIIEAAKHMDKDTLLEVGKKLTKDGAEEGLEEIFQGATEVVGEKLFTPKQNEILTKNTAIDLASQGALGMAGGIVIHKDKYDDFINMFEELYTDDIPDDDCTIDNIEIPISEDNINYTLFNDYISYSPYGEGYKEPHFCLSGTLKFMYKIPAGFRLMINKTTFIYFTKSKEEINLISELGFGSNVAVLFTPQVYTLTDGGIMFSTSVKEIRKI
jgi:hypothetical protein